MRRGSIAANPVLIGAATTLVVIVAVFLSYNANNGLPFVPTYQLTAQVPNAANLVVGNEVRIGGARVGVIDEITPVRLSNGRTIARLHLKLEQIVKPLPKDSTVLIRMRSALGLKYLQITKGQSSQGYAEGATLPLSAARPTPVEFDEAVSTFNAKTRDATQRQVTGLGDAFAGRGQDLNRAIQAFDPLLVQLIPAMENLSDRRTQLDRIFRALGRTSAELAPVAGQQGELFANLDRTFTGLASVARPYIQDTISGGPPALDTATRELPRQNQFLDDSTRLFAALRPGIHALAGSADDLADTVDIGAPALRESVKLNDRLKPTFATLEDFVKDPLDQLGVRDLRATATIANPLFSFITPAQTVCNYATLLFRNAASMVSAGDSVGTAQRFQLVVPGGGPNNEGGPAAAPANGGGATPTTNYLHQNPYPNTAAPGQTKECEAGNEDKAGFPLKQVIGNVPGNQGTTTEKTVRSVKK